MNKCSTIPNKTFTFSKKYCRASRSCYMFTSSMVAGVVESATRKLYQKIPERLLILVQASLEFGEKNWKATENTLCASLFVYLGAALLSSSFFLKCHTLQSKKHSRPGQLETVCRNSLQTNIEFKLYWANNILQTTDYILKRNKE